MKTVNSFLIFLIIFFGVLTIKSIAVSAATSNALTSETENNFGILKDFGLINIKENQRPKSDWLEMQKTLYKNLLQHGKYEVLIVPFQVQGYAIDRAGRSLMTRYLSDRIERASGAKIPDFTLVARALGENARTFNDEEIYELANKLKVKILIKGYVGHNMDEKMKVTLLIQQQEILGFFSSQTPANKLSWQYVQFSDEHPPSEVFFEHLDEIMYKLPFTKTQKSSVVIYDKINNLPLPSKFLDIVNAKNVSPIINAYYLQFLGLLYPEESIARDHLFERSLIALSPVSGKSPDYAILKARAFFYLYLRPAALAAIGLPKSPEEKAFSALLNGNLLELEKKVDEITSPLQKLIAQIELNDLRWSYGQNTSNKKLPMKIAETFPDLAMVLTHRFQSNDEWVVQSNIIVKQKLDETFPIPDFTAENIVKSKMTLGESPFEEDEAIEFSVYNHSRKLLEKGEEGFCCLSGNSSPVALDYLHLLSTIGEYALLKNIHLLIFQKGMTESALETLNRYEQLYLGHPEMTYLKAVALYRLFRIKQEYARENLQKEYRRLAYNSYYWFQGQTKSSSKAYLYLPETFFSQPNPYDGDYPQRPYWLIDGLGDRTIYKNSLISRDTSFLNTVTKNRLKKLEVALLYTHDSFNALTSFYEALLNSKMNKEAEILLDANKSRFVGHPDFNVYFAKLEETKSNIAMAIMSYEKAIIATPESWKPYLGLGKLYIKEGNFKKALETFQKYPLFKKDGYTNIVALSKYAFEAGYELFYRGAIEEAKILLRRSADYETGSAAEMFSLALLSLIEGDYNQASEHYLNLVRRYNSNHAHYMSILNVMGYQEQALMLLNTLDPMEHSKDILIAALLGFRSKGNTDEKIFKWLTSKMKKPATQSVYDSLLINYMLDRFPDKHLSDFESKNETTDPSAGLFQQRNNIQLILWFADGYYVLRRGEYKQAYEIFKTRLDYPQLGVYEQIRYALPYFVWGCIKNDKLSEIENYLKTYENTYSEDFYLHLSKAFINGSKAEHEKAIYHLEKAWFSVKVEGSKPILTWYQLIEATEWLYDDTKNVKYRDLALKLAKTYQVIFPMYAWAYAVEAKYTNSDKDRIKAIALTLYLDKHSERASKFSIEDKKKAIEWLETNNPFSLQKTGKQPDEI